METRGGAAQREWPERHLLCHRFGVCHGRNLLIDWQHSLRHTGWGTAWSGLAVSGERIVSLSCPASSAGSDAACMAVGDLVNGSLNGGVNVTTDGGQSWTATAPPVMNGYVMDVVTCPTSNECIAEGRTNTSQMSDEFFVTTDFGSSWSAVPATGSGSLVSISCSSAATCVAVGGSVVTTDNGGISWSPVTSYPRPNGGLWGVSCAVATSDCEAVGAEIGTTNAGVVLLSVDNGATWTSGTLPSGVAPLERDLVRVRLDLCRGRLRHRLDHRCRRDLDSNRRPRRPIEFHRVRCRVVPRCRFQRGGPGSFVRPRASAVAM